MHIKLNGEKVKKINYQSVETQNEVVLGLGITFKSNLLVDLVRLLHLFCLFLQCDTMIKNNPIHEDVVSLDGLYYK